jgi:ubiquinone/menaquinone biosynthesis C-methylase UbiE
MKKLNKGIKADKDIMARIKPFEIFPDRYEEWFEINSFVYESELQAVKQLMPEGGKGIEVGVGSGRFAAPLGITSGIEPSAEMRRIARSRGIEAIDGVAESLPFKDTQFDFVLMVTTICFLDDINAAFGETFRVLKPEGYFIICFIDKESPIGQFYYKHKDENPFYKIADFYSVNEVTQHLKQAGFDCFHFTQTVFHNLSEIKEVEPVKEWYGKGSFVVIRAKKKHTISKRTSKHKNGKPHFMRN